MSQLRTDLRASALLVGALYRRLVREGMIVRSLTFPIALVIGTLVVTIGVVAWLRYTPLIAMTPELDQPELMEPLHEQQFITLIRDDPRAAIAEEGAWAATDGETLWLSGGGPGALVVESLLRERNGAPWLPSADVPRPGLNVATTMGRGVVVLLSVLFSLYGVVFGAGMVARDRDDATFEVELSLGVSRWVHGFVRVVAGSSVLAAFLCLGVALCAAILGVDDPVAMSRHAVACAIGSTCIGLLCVGRAGIQSGFSSALALGMSAATATFGIGIAAPAIGRFVPMASLVAGPSSGWAALGGSFVLAALSVLVFTRRSAMM